MAAASNICTTDLSQQPNRQKYFGYKNVLPFFNMWLQSWRDFEMGHEIQWNIWAVAVILLPVSCIEIKKDDAFIFLLFSLKVEDVACLCLCHCKINIDLKCFSKLRLFVLCENKANVMIYKSGNDNFNRYVFFIPHICHEPHKYIRVNFFWPVLIFSDLTQKFGNLLCILP